MKAKIISALILCALVLIFALVFAILIQSKLHKKELEEQKKDIEERIKAKIEKQSGIINEAKRKKERLSSGDKERDFKNSLEALKEISNKNEKA